MEAIQLYNRTHKVKDSRFNIEHLGSYSLNILVSDSDCSVAVIDTKESRCLYSEKCEFEKVYSSKQQIKVLVQIFEEHHFLRAGYWKNINVSLKNDKFSLVPLSLFDESVSKDYLRLNCEVNEKEESINFYKHKNVGACNIFTLNNDLQDWFKNIYPTREINFLHQTSSFIEGITKVYTDRKKQLAVLCDHNSLNIALIENKNLIYCNVFNYNTPEDLLYFIMYVMNELELSPEKIPVTIWGDFDQTSIYFAKLYKYIRYLNLGHRPETISFGYVFDEIFEHSSFDVFNLHLCE